MLTTTFKQLRKFNACTDRYDFLSEALGGVGEYGDETPITLGQVFDICGFDDTCWLIYAQCRQDRIDGKNPPIELFYENLTNCMKSPR